MKFKTKAIRFTNYALLFLVIFNYSVIARTDQGAAQAAANLVKGGDFEAGITDYWGVFVKPESSRTYEMYRSYDVPFGNGSYSIAVDAHGARGTAFDAFLIGNTAKNKFAVETGKEYYITLNAKGTAGMNILAVLEDATTFNVITPVQGMTVTGSWQKFKFFVTPTANTSALFALAVGEMPDGSTLIIDGVSVTEYNPRLSTTEIRGYTGEKNKCLKFSDISQFTPGDVEVSLPYYDSQTSTSTVKRFRPESMTNNTMCINMYDQTFSGVGNVYINSRNSGKFTYTVLPKVDDFYPTLARADEDIMIEGSGFSPIPDNTFAVMQAMDASGKIGDVWVKPHIIEPTLKQIVVKAPLGTVSGRIYVQTSYLDSADQVKVLKSNISAYKVMPIIYRLEWASRGFDQVGDALRIKGKGISNNPTVKFYNDKNEVVAKTRAKVTGSIGDEVIEVATPKNINQLKVTVEVDGIESAAASSLLYTAKPRLSDIITKQSRTLYESSEKLMAAKIGEVITVRGEGFLYPERTTTVEFQGLDARIRIDVPASDIDPKGTSLKVAVPAGTQTGYINVEVNSERSNYKPVEIIPTVLGVSPDPIVPGGEITVTANGMGNNLNLATVYFHLTDDKEIAVVPNSLETATSGQTLIRVNAPLAISNSQSSINLQYNLWRDDAKVGLAVPPRITEASIDMDSRILVIKGYGLSIVPKENILTFKNNDEAHTVVNPPVRLLGVYPTEEGQEFRVQILNDYHYGFVSVTVGGQASNEVSFGPLTIRKIVRRVQYVEKYGAQAGVLYITGHNFGPTGGVRVGTTWADVHYRSDFFIIAVVDQSHVYDNPVIVARE